MKKWIKKLFKPLLKRCFPRMCRKLGNIKYWHLQQAKYRKRNGREPLTVYALGMVSVSKESLAKTKELLEPADFCVAYLKNYHANQLEKLNEFGIDAFCVAKVRAAEDLNYSKFVGENSGKIFVHKNMKIGVIHFQSTAAPKLLWEIINKLKHAGAKFLILYISYESLDRATEILMRRAAKRVNQVIGVGEEKPFNSLAGTNKVMPSIGSFNKRQHRGDAKSGCVIIKNEVTLHNKKVINLERSYIPCVFDGAEGSVRKLDVHVQNDLAVRRQLSENIVSPPEESRSIDLGKLFEVLDIQPTGKFLELLDWPVKKICVYPFEIGTGSVLFLREYDQVVHEKDRETYYKELVEKIYGHMRKGLILAFSPIDLPDDIPHIKVDHPLLLHRILCKYIVDLCDFEFKVALTGSTGKTSAKEMIAVVLAQKYRTFKNPGNENLQVKMGPMLQEFRPCYEAYVQEVGGGKIGGASNVSKMLEPDVGVITNIGYSHLRWSKTREQLAINKVGIADGIRNNGPLFINLDNDMLQTVDVTGRNVITYAIDNPDADYKAENIRPTENGMVFDIVHEGVAVECELNVPGEYNIYNALIGFGVGEYAGISHDKIREAIASFKTEGIRQTLIKLGGYNLFVDCYNAAPDSMIGAVETLAKMGGSGSSRIAVLADMTGLEELSVGLHQKVGREISNFEIEHLICYGNDSKEIYDSYSNSNAQKYFFANKEEVIDAIKKLVKPGDYILFKGSSKFKLEQDIVDAVWGTNLTTIAHERKKENLYKTNDLTYRLFPNFAHAYSAQPTKAVIHILDGVKGKNVTSVRSGAFANCVNATVLKLPKYLRNIQSEAFKNCKKLREVKLPDETMFIEDNAFENCVSLQEFSINEKLIHIGSNVFKGCALLEKIYIPGSVAHIGENAFEGCENICIICEADSYAARYAEENGIRAEYKDTIEA